MRRRRAVLDAKLEGIRTENRTIPMLGSRGLTGHPLSNPSQVLTRKRLSLVSWSPYWGPKEALKRAGDDVLVFVPSMDAEPGW